MTLIAFGWSGLPDYAARCIRAVMDTRDERIDIVATRPRVPIEGMERSLGKEVNWLEDGHLTLNWSDLDLPRPDIFFQGGYYLPALRALGAEARASGGKVVLMSDNNWQGTMRQRFVDPLRHRLLLRWRFDAVMTPGKSGTQYGAHLGYQRIVSGMLGADPRLFNGGDSLCSRPKTFLFAGRLIKLKNVLGLVRAFARFAQENDDWMLRICGSGPLREQIPDHPRIDVRGFVQPPELADLMREARCLVLPSFTDHWGLVVHEATLCGCALALSSCVGAADDLATPENAVFFSPRAEERIEDALHAIAGWNDARWDAAERTSRALATQFGPHRFAAEAGKLIDSLTVEAA